MKFPSPKSKIWWAIWLVLAALNAGLLLLSREMLHQSIPAMQILYFCGISLLIASGMSIAGYLGKKPFALVMLIGNVLALAYVFYLVLTRAKGGFADIGSVVGYIFICAIGFLAAGVVQIIISVLKKK